MVASHLARLSCVLVALCALCTGALTGRCVVVQNKGGGHGTLGYSLCKQLRAGNPELQLTLLQDKCNRKKEPFASYGELEALGVEIVDGDVSEGVAKLSGAAAKFDYVVDNWSKSEANAATVVGLAKACGAKQLVFVSSGGMYKGTPAGVMPLVEESAVKENDARKVELAVEASAVPFTFVRPQYIYGPKSSKRYLDFFLGRVVRGVPIPLPLHGEQLLSLTHVDDAAALIALTLGHPAALGQVFNCASDRLTTYRGLCEALHDLNGSPADKRKYLYYEPKDFDHWDGGSVVEEFPFRRETFVVSPSKAKQLLGFAPKHALAADLAAELADYKRDSSAEQWGLRELRYDLEILASQDQTFALSYAFLDDLGRVEGGQGEQGGGQR